MKPIEFIAQDIFDKVRSRFENLEMGDDAGSVTSDPALARFFDFDFIIAGNKLGRVSISINEIGSLKVFYGQGLLDDADVIIREYWYNFLKEMRNFAKRRMLRFDTRDITKQNLNKTDFQYLASKGTKEESMKESKMFGSSKSSYLPLAKTRLIIRHTGKVDETRPGSRSRNINSIYIENQEGERYKMPLNHMGCAKVMQRHVANEGRPYDEAGQAIIKMGEQMLQLSEFKRKIGRHDSMNKEANDIMERANIKLENLRAQMQSLCKQRHYESWMAERNAGGSDAQMVMDQAAMEDYKSKFTVNTYNEELSQYFPLLYSIMQETSEVDLEQYVEESTVEVEDFHTEQIDTFAAFESWANSVVEGRLPDDIITDLGLLLSAGLTLGVDGTNAIESLQQIGIDDMDLTSALESMAKVNSDSDASHIVISWLEKFDPDAAEQMQSSLPETPAPAAPEVAPEEGIGGVMGGIAGAAITKSPAGAMAGREIGNDIDDVLGISQDKDEDEDIQEKSSAKPDMHAIAEMVHSFYDRETGKFPMGETGVITKVKKEFGDHAGKLAERLVNHLCSQRQDTDELSDIVRLGGGSALDRVAKRAQSRKSSGEH